MTSSRARARRGNRTLRDTIESEKRHMNHFDYRLRRIKSTGKPHIHHYAKYLLVSVDTYLHKYTYTYHLLSNSLSHELTEVTLSTPICLSQQITNNLL